jgi:hypothetical protein
MNNKQNRGPEGREEVESSNIHQNNEVYRGIPTIG